MSHEDENDEYLTMNEYYQDWLFDNKDWLKKAYIEELIEEKKNPNEDFNEDDFDAYCRQQYKDRE